MTSARLDVNVLVTFSFFVLSVTQRRIWSKLLVSVVKINKRKHEFVAALGGEEQLAMGLVLAFSCVLIKTTGHVFTNARWAHPQDGNSERCP